MFQQLHSKALELRCMFFPKLSPGREILAFADMGLGNLIYFLPTLKELDKFSLTVYCPDKEKRELLRANLGGAIVPLIPDKKYDTVVANFLCQRNEDVWQIIWRKIPARIGHGEKYSWLFNHWYPFDGSRSEIESNADLLEPFDLKVSPLKLHLPKTDITESYDILIQPHSSFDPRKNWGKYYYLLNYLREYKIAMIGSKAEHEYIAQNFHNVTNLAGKYSLAETLQLIKNSTLLIGNNGGLEAAADFLGTKVIQIYRWWSDSFIRTRIPHGVNMIEPTVDEVYNEVKRLLA